MPKICQREGCNKKVFSNGYCKNDQYLRQDEKYLTQKNKPKSLTPIKSNNKPIKKVSDTLKKNLAIYKPRRDKYMEDHPVCEAQLEGCTYYSTDLHHSHKFGRLGELLYDVKFFRALCRNCHNKQHF